ncbi:MAG: RNA polymerase sigma factor FliA [Sphingomonadaceae bacterium]|nr:RNA polymerase sigma factor FliA [Sphingomonadaceae bacterium]
MDARLALTRPGHSGLGPADQRIAAHQGLVRRIARHVHARISSAIEVEDLVQIGTVALIEAARCFEDRGEATFATYATIRVRGSMIDALRKSATMVRSAIRRRREIAITRASLEASLRRTPTEGEIAAEMGLSLADYRQILEASNPPRHEAIDDIYSDQSAWFADPAPNAHDVLARERLKTAVSAAVGALPPREALILQLYFVEEMNLEEIGATLDIGAARVCQIKKAALAKIRARLAGWEG